MPTEWLLFLGYDMEDLIGSCILEEGGTYRRVRVPNEIREEVVRGFRGNVLVDSSNPMYEVACRLAKRADNGKVVLISESRLLEDVVDAYINPFSSPDKLREKIRELSE